MRQTLTDGHMMKLNDEHHPIQLEFHGTHTVLQTKPESYTQNQ